MSGIRAFQLAVLIPLLLLSYSVSEALADTTPPTAPTLSLGSATATGLTATWSGATDAVAVTGYRLDVSMVNNFASFVGYNNLDVGNVTTTVISGLTPKTTYYVRVRAYDAAGNVSPNSNGKNLSTQADSTAPTAPTVSLGGATVNSLSASWSGATDNVAVTGYRLDVSTVSTFASFVTGYNNLDVGNVTTKTITGPTPRTTYYVRVRAHDAAGKISVNSNVASLTIADSTPPTAPTVGVSSATQNSLTATWSGATDNVAVIGYRLDVSTVDTFASFVPGYQDLNVLNVTSKVIRGLSAATTYYVRVRAYDATGNVSLNSNVASLATLSDGTAPRAPTLSLGSATQTSLTATWSGATDNVAVTGYRLDVSTVNTFASFVGSYNNLDVGNVTTKTITGLTPRTTYYVRVRAYDAAGNVSPNSSVKNLATIADSTAPTAPTVSLGGAMQNSLTAAWSGATDNVAVTGYRLDVSTMSTFASFVTGYNNLDVGNVLTKTITGLSQGTTYYVRVRAYDAAGKVSGSSPTATAATTANPTVSAISPNQGVVGSTLLITITGANFQNGASVSAGMGVTVSSVTVGSPMGLTATLMIASDATVGTRDVTITNPDSKSGTLTGGFAVVAAMATGDTNYVYDRLGRLIAVITGSEMAIYQYDSVGNLLSITRQSSAAVSILDFSPRSGSPGTNVTILGTGFSSTVSQNTVSFNGVSATVMSATTTQLVVQVPFGGTLGPIAVSSPNGSATSTKLFGVSP